MPAWILTTLLCRHVAAAPHSDPLSSIPTPPFLLNPSPSLHLSSSLPSRSRRSGRQWSPIRMADDRPITRLYGPSLDKIILVSLAFPASIFIFMAWEWLAPDCWALYPRPVLLVLRRRSASSRVHIQPFSPLLTGNRLVGDDCLPPLRSSLFYLKERTWNFVQKGRFILVSIAASLFPLHSSLATPPCLPLPHPTHLSCDWVCLTCAAVCRPVCSCVGSPDCKQTIVRPEVKCLI